jgi:GNAT superfamily N-acetyltransferase
MITMTQATMSDLDDLIALLEARRDWLHNQGIDQWSTRKNWRSPMADAIARGDTWVARQDGRIVGTLTLTSTADPDFWSPEESIDHAIYINKMATALTAKGQGLGAAILTWARQWATDHGYDYVRWDAWRTNEQLIAYYRSLGATWIRTVNAPHRQSGALFQIGTLTPSNTIITAERP